MRWRAAGHSGRVLLLGCLVIGIVYPAVPAARALLPPTPPVVSPSSSSVTAGSSVRFASVGADGQPARGNITGMAISADGRSVVFSTSAAVRTSATVVPTGGKQKSGGNSAIYVHDPNSGATTLLSDPSNSSFAPSVSADGRLVSYDDEAAHAIVVVNRLATGGGALDGPGNFVNAQVTGTGADLPQERVTPCTGEAPGPSWVPCGPVLSLDGDSLAYPITQDAVSPSLAIGVSLNGSAPSGLVGNVIDFTPSNIGQGYGFGPQVSTVATITYTNEDLFPVAMRGMQLDQPGGSAAAGPFSLGATTCTAVLTAQASCSARATFDPGTCPAALTAPALSTAELTTDAATPAGQSAILLSATCDSFYSGTATVPPPPACPATPSGLDLVPAPLTQSDNQGTAIEDTGTAEIGRPYVTWQVITVPANETVNGHVTVAFLPANLSDCGLQLVDPASLDILDPLPATAPPPCTEGQVFSRPVQTLSCTAYVLVRPQAVALDEALLGMIYFPHLPVRLLGPELVTPTAIISSRGIHSLILVRHDPTGTGQFAGAPTVVANVDSAGTLLPGASQPALSANGRYVSFAAPVPLGSSGGQAMIGSSQVWRHDTDVGANGKGLPGPTVLVSCLPAEHGQPCQSPPDAQSPSMSADGNSVAFATTGTSPSPQQVYLRDVLAASTQLMSSSRTGAGAGADGPSWAPALSPDGSAIVFASAATDLAAPATPAGATNLYIRQLSTRGPPQLITQSSLPVGYSMLAPTIDMHGRFIAFGTDAPLLPFPPGGAGGDGISVMSGYLLERHPDLAATPATLHIDAALLDTSTPMTFRVTNRGPGPATVTAVSTIGSVSIVGENCDPTVLLPGATCTITASFTAESSGPQAGAVLLTTDDDGEPAQLFTFALTANVVVPRLSTSPDVAGPGEVTQITGDGFPPGTSVTLTWNPGLGSRSVRTDAAGTLHAWMVVFPGDAQGPRILDASTSNRPTLASAPFLVEADWLPLRPP